MTLYDITESGVYKYTIEKNISLYDPTIVIVNYLVIISGEKPFLKINGIFDLENGSQLSNDFLRGKREHTIEKINI